eukprot:evm.model.scf_2020EXC.3 EVM.evm.TU.scf_2020EXC.3   scf_2020EXC:20432-23766(+)
MAGRWLPLGRRAAAALGGGAKDATMKACGGAWIEGMPTAGMASEASCAHSPGDADGATGRVYRNVGVERAEGKGGYAVLLDGRALKTPAGHQFVLPTYRLALAIAAEWEWQKGRSIWPITMPIHSLAATSIDMPKPRIRVIEDMLHFIHTDAVCCRVDPGELADKQAEMYNPLVSWVVDRFGVQLELSDTIFGAQQSESTVDVFHQYLQGLDAWHLTAADAMASSCKSLIIGLALLNDRVSLLEAIEISRLEEEFQIGAWGLVEGGHDLDIAETK